MYESKYYDLCDPPISVLVHDGPWLNEHSRRLNYLNIASLLPGSRPKDITESIYFRERHPNITAERCEDICQLIDSIISDGITEGAGGWDHCDENGKLVEHSMKTWLGPIGFIIGRKGELYFCDGHHRKEICCLLNIPFPAYIVSVDKEWKKLWQGDTRYDYYPHPYVENKGTIRKKSDLRFRRISDWLRTKGIREVTDLGSHQGYFPNVLAKSGFVVHSVEPSYGLRSLAKYWHEVEHLSVAQYTTLNQAPKTDALTVLNAVHHIAQTDADLESFLNQIVGYKTIVLELANDNQNWNSSVTLGRTTVEQRLLRNGFSSEVIHFDNESTRLTNGYFMV